MSKLTKPQAEELAAELYDRTTDIIKEELYEMLYEFGKIEELDDDAIDIMNAVMEHYWAYHIVKNW